VRIGIEAGAQLGNMTEGWWYQIALEHVVQSGQTAGGFFMPFGDSMIEVNRHGRRVVNEKAAYNERGAVHFAWDGREYSNLVLFYIYDEGVHNNTDPIGFRYPVPQPDEDVNYVIKGETLEELAANIDERLAQFAEHTAGLVLDDEFLPNLKETIERFNGFARTGIDKDFGRGDSAISKFWGGQLQAGAKNTMFPISDTGPYYCILAVAGALDTCGGPKINTKAQVLSTRNEPIPGLYGAGNCIASPAGQAYWGPGATIGPALTFGYIAGLNAAKESEKLL
jgi:3-oxosteroid 1-dehydrogenase